MTTISIKELRPKLPSIINNVDKKFDRIVITKRGKPTVVMLSIDDYESTIETLTILSDKAGLKRIKKGMSEIRSGKTIPLSEIKKKIKF